ncbi:hypothetical protein BH20ACT2_BH20ACT2_05280 [soil metagenome]
MNEQATPPVAASQRRSLGKAWGATLALGAATVALVRVRVLLGRHGLDDTLARLATTTTTRRRAVSPERRMRAVQRAGRVVGGACLEQSLALAELLVRDGHRPELVLGCRRYGPGEWGAHAWVEVDGRHLEPVVAPEHQELDRRAVLG